MNDETKKFLLKCKDAGYKWISIGVKDKRVPSSLKIEWYGERKFCSTPNAGGYTGGISIEDLDGKQVGWRVQPYVVCAEPKIRDSGRPAIWDICKSIFPSGSGSGETHNISADHTFDIGVYDLAEI